MSVPARRVMDPSHRARVLRALDMVPWVRRAAPMAIAEATVEVEEASVLAPAPAPAQGEVACVVVLPAGAAPRELDLLGRAFGTCGAGVARAARVAVAADGQLSAAPPAADAYLVFGETQAHALGRALSAEAMQRAQIVLVDEPAQLLMHAAAKRRLWTALRTLRRAMAAAGG